MKNTSKLFQIIRKIHHDFFSDHCFLELKRQSEFSRLCPDKSSLLFSDLLNISTFLNNDIQKETTCTESIVYKEQVEVFIDLYKSFSRFFNHNTQQIQQILVLDF